MKPCRISMINNNMRQVFRTQGFEYQKQPAFLTAAINRKAGSDSHLPRFFSFSSENQFVVPPLGGSVRRKFIPRYPALPPKGGTTNCAFHCFRASQRHIDTPQNVAMVK